MTVVDQIVLTLQVPSIEETAAWYERMLGWERHYDIFDDEGHCLFGSVALQTEPFVGFNLSRAPQTVSGEVGAHCASWIYVADVAAIYERVINEGWPVEAALKDQPWGERLFQLRDLNGHQLVIVQQIE